MENSSSKDLSLSPLKVTKRYQSAVGDQNDHTSSSTALFVTKAQRQPRINKFRTTKQGASGFHVCTFCETNKTPQWRFFKSSRCCNRCWMQQNRATKRQERLQQADVFKSFHGVHNYYSEHHPLAVNSNSSFFEPIYGWIPQQGLPAGKDNFVQVENSYTTFNPVDYMLGRSSFDENYPVKPSLATDSYCCIPKAQFHNSSEKN